MSWSDALSRFPLALRDAPAWLDRAIASLSPGWGAARAQARLRMRWAEAGIGMLSTYDAAEVSRTTRDWDKGSTSAIGALADANTLNARARAAIRDTWQGRSAVEGEVRHVVGTGITARSAAIDPATKQRLPDLSRDMDDWWDLWAYGQRPNYCDVEGRKTILDFEALITRELMAVGHVMVVLGYTPRPEMPGLMLQAVEHEQLDGMRQKNADNGNQIVNGVEVDGYTKPVAYWIYVQTHPNDFYRSTASTRVPAERVLHLIRPERVRQVIGETRFACVLKKIWHASMYDEYMLIRARGEACMGMAIEADPDAAQVSLAKLFPNVQGDTEDLAGNPKFQFEPGMILDLPRGRRANWHTPQTPGNTYEGFTRSQANAIAAGAGTDRPTLTRDFSGSTFSGLRQALLEGRQGTNPEQVRLTAGFLRPVREEFLTIAALERRFPFPPLLLTGNVVERAQLLRCDYQPQAEMWIDPLKQAAALEKLLKLRGISIGMILNQMGVNRSDVFRDIAADREEAAANGFSLDGDAPAPAAEEGPPEGGTPNGGNGRSGGNGQSAARDILDALLLHQLMTEEEPLPSGRF